MEASQVTINKLKGCIFEKKVEKILLVNSIKYKPEFVLKITDFISHRLDFFIHNDKGTSTILECKNNDNISLLHASIVGTIKKQYLPFLHLQKDKFGSIDKFIFVSNLGIKAIEDYKLTDKWLGIKNLTITNTTKIALCSYKTLMDELKSSSKHKATFNIMSAVRYFYNILFFIITLATSNEDILSIIYNGDILSSKAPIDDI